MLRRRSDLLACAKFRTRHKVPLGDLEAWALVIAEVCLYHPKGFDYYTFRDIQPKALDLTEDEVMDAFHQVDRIAKRKGVTYRPMSAATVGKLLDGFRASRKTD
jgi:hypothetical protein